MNKLGRLRRAIGITLTTAVVITGTANFNYITAFAASGTVTATVLNVRAGESTSDSIVTTLNQGTVVEIISTNGDWHKIDVNGTTGYIHKDYVATGDGGSAAVVTSGTGTVNVSALNLRSQPSTEADKVGMLYQGQTVTIEATEGAWYKVNASGISAYVFAEYITPGGSAPTGTAETDNNGSGTPGTANVNTLNVRDGASMTASVLGTIDKGTSVTVLETSGDWYKINLTLNGTSTTGYAYKTYITTSSTNTDSGDATVTDVNETVWATTSVNVRSSSSTTSSIITTISKDTSVTRTGTLSNNWSKVEYNGQAAYIHSDYLTAIKPDSVLGGGSGGTTNSGVSGQQIVDFAMKYVGYPYVYGGNNLNTGVDCSGFVQQVYLNFGIKLSRVADAQKSDGRRITLAEAQPGDLIFYGSSSYANHVAIYIGNGQVVHASNSRTGIITSNVSYREPVAVVRILN